MFLVRRLKGQPLYVYSHTCGINSFFSCSLPAPNGTLASPVNCADHTDHRPVDDADATDEIPARQLLLLRRSILHDSILIVNCSTVLIRRGPLPVDDLLVRELNLTLTPSILILVVLFNNLPFSLVTSTAGP